MSAIVRVKANMHTVPKPIPNRPRKKSSVGMNETRLTARAVSRVSFMPTLDFFLGLFGIGFGTVCMFAFTRTIADMPRVPREALGYITDGWLGIWIVWAAVLVGCFFWALWIDATLGRDPRPRPAAPAPDDEYDYEDDEAA